MQQSPILYGKEAPDAEFGSVAAIVVAVTNDDKPAYYAYCSGVLVAPNVILTAAHCITDDKELPFKALFKANKVVAIFDQNIGEPQADRIFELSSYAANPDYDSITLMNDIGLLWLKSDVPVEIAKPQPMLTDYSALQNVISQKIPVDFVGYGMDENQVYNVRRYYTDVLNEWCSQSWCKIDDTYMPYGSVSHLIDDGGPCNGDSGGAVMVAIDEMRYVLAVVSFGDETCTRYDVSTTVAAHRNWIDAKLNPKASSGGCSVVVQHGNSGWGCLLATVLMLLTVVFRRARRV